LSGKVLPPSYILPCLVHAWQKVFAIFTVKFISNHFLQQLSRPTRRCAGSAALKMVKGSAMTKRHGKLPKEASTPKRVMVGVFIPALSPQANRPVTTESSQDKISSSTGPHSIPDQELLDIQLNFEISVAANQPFNQYYQGNCPDLPAPGRRVRLIATCIGFLATLLLLAMVFLLVAITYNIQYPVSYNETYEDVIRRYSNLPNRPPQPLPIQWLRSNLNPPMTFPSVLLR
jgi:hypothetical protein